MTEENVKQPGESARDRLIREFINGTTCISDYVRKVLVFAAGLSNVPVEESNAVDVAPYLLCALEWIETRARETAEKLREIVSDAKS